MGYKKIKQLIFAIVLFILVLLSTKIFVFDESEYSKVNDDEYLFTEIKQVNLEYETKYKYGEEAKIEKLFWQHILAGQQRDLDKYFSYVYQGSRAATEIDWIRRKTENIGGKMTTRNAYIIKLYLLNLYGHVENAEFEIANIDLIDEDEAVAEIEVKKEGQSKKNQYYYFIKKKNRWYINAFGYNHTPDVVLSSRFSETEGLQKCDLICDEKNLWGENNMYDPETNQCICYYDELQKYNFNENLYLSECANKRSRQSRSLCYKEFAEINQDEKYCLQVSSLLRDECFENVADAKNDLNVCSYLINDSYCINSIEK